ncbi:hypothetical protein EPO34_04840 [Patescibacteria group bacterium]|nr:MAG: hypothetical protein EPO34_04840 [Patescibacteria group bacterium]
MSHPHASILKEFQIAIDHIVPSVPPEVKAQALKRHAELLGNENASQEEIEAALAQTGMAEYPHRKASQEMAGKLEEDTRLALVLEHVDENVRTKLKKHLDAGVPLVEIVRSDLFETEFTGPERYQVEDGLLDAADHVREEMAKAIDPLSEKYKKLVAKWQEHAEEIKAKIDELEALADKDPKWKDEILSKVERFREGFSVTEQDPELEEVKKEIEYWKDTFGEGL